MQCGAESSPTIDSCHLENCSAESGGGAILCDDLSSPRIDSCTLIGNVALREDGGQGGAFWCDNSQAIITDCLVIANSTVGPEGLGGAIYCDDGDASTFERCLIVGNESALKGGGIYCVGAFPSFIGCTISSNLAEDTGGGIYATEGSTPSLNRTILWGNCGIVGEDAWIEDGAVLEVICSVVDTLGISGSMELLQDNVFDDPLFCDPQPCGEGDPWHVEEEYTLQSDSPCLPGNNKCGILIGALPVGCPVSSVPDPRDPRILTWGRLKTVFRE
jgi:predicted outer membrane repeat protein